MRLLTLGFIICQITVRPQAEKFGPRFPQRVRNHEPSEPRFRSDHPGRDYPSYDDGITRKEFHLPVTFKAPPYERHDYWTSNQDYNQDYSDRRTFFEDFSRLTPEKSLPALYQFMRSVFNGRITSEHPQTFHYDHNRATPPYKFVSPYAFTPTEPNYIPPPKPIRASVIKLETITRSPIYPPFEYETTAKYYPHVKALLNQVLIENSKAQQNRSWYVHEPNAEILPFKPLPVLPKPEHVPPTTLRPTHSGFFNPEQPRHFFDYYNKTDYRYPESVQDQLPHLSLGDIRIPYVSEKPIPQIFNSPPTESLRQIGYVANFFPPSDATTKANALVDVRSLKSPGTDVRRERPNGIHVEFATTTVKSFPGAVEKVKRPTFKYTKKLTAQLDKSPVERVTNLTVLGLSKVEKENVNPYKQANYVNVRELINYEMGKLGNVSQVPDRPDNSSTRSVNLNDELSLDAKILKDTNWDGLIVPETPTIEVPSETETTTTAVTTTTSITTFQTVRPVEPKTHKIAFWEIQSTDVPSSSDATTTVTDQTKPQTTEFTLWPSTPEPTDPVTIELGTEVPAKAERRSEKPAAEKPTTETPETREVSFPPDRTIFKRRYSRRPKIINFTPYPTAEEIQKKLTNRSSHIFKRQKPNITLAFGNKNVLKNRQSFGKDEVMKFSDEDVRKRRKTEKRRHVHKRPRVSTSERPVQDDQL